MSLVLGRASKIIRGAFWVDLVVAIICEVRNRRTISYEVVGRRFDFVVLRFRFIDFATSA
jgi:hypothetical protein